ncbi:hypothetical protein V8C86DRAFT_3124623 [Haematococcus lacustris]
MTGKLQLQSPAGAEGLRQERSGGQLLFRGLRLKAGVDFGYVSTSVHAALARITYLGRVMNR